MILRFLRASPGAKKFNVKCAYKVMKKYQEWSVQLDLPNLTASRVADQLQTQCLVIPGSLTKQGHSILYMRPAKYFPATYPLEDLMRSLVYLLERMTEREKTATEGLAFMANMADWGWSNFSVRYAKNFFDTMQGRFPCRVRLFLIVDPPSWFGAIWRLIRPMMSADFAAKVFLPKREELHNFIDGAQNIPKELGGTLDLPECLNAFIKYRQYVEQLKHENKDGVALDLD